MYCNTLTFLDVTSILPSEREKKPAVLSLQVGIKYKMSIANSFAYQREYSLYQNPYWSIRMSIGITTLNSYSLFYTKNKTANAGYLQMDT